MFCGQRYVIYTTFYIHNFIFCSQFLTLSLFFPLNPLCTFAFFATTLVLYRFWIMYIAERLKLAVKLMFFFLFFSFFLLLFFSICVVSVHARDFCPSARGLLFCSMLFMTVRFCVFSVVKEKALNGKCMFFGGKKKFKRTKC